MAQVRNEVSQLLGLSFTDTAYHKVRCRKCNLGLSHPTPSATVVIVDIKGVRHEITGGTMISQCPRCSTTTLTIVATMT